MVCSTVSDWVNEWLVGGWLDEDVGDWWTRWVRRCASEISSLILLHNITLCTCKWVSLWSALRSSSLPSLLCSLLLYLYHGWWGGPGVPHQRTWECICMSVKVETWLGWLQVNSHLESDKNSDMVTRTDSILFNSILKIYGILSEEWWTCYKHVYHHRVIWDLPLM